MNIIKGRCNLCNRQPLGFRHKFVGKVQKVGRRRNKDEERKGLRELQQYGKGERYQPIGHPIDKDADRHGTVTGSHGEDFGNDKPRNATGSKGKENDYSRHGNNRHLHYVSHEQSE